MRRSWSLASSFVLSLTLGACPPSDETPDAGSVDAGRLSCRGNVAVSVPSPDGEGFCCLPREPTCDCASIGGFVTDESDCVGGFGSGRVCDVAPPDWGACTMDEHGCPHVTLTTTGACCNCITFDAGLPDADLGDADLGDADLDAGAVSECASIGGTCVLPSGSPAPSVSCPPGSMAIPGSETGLGGYRQLGCGSSEAGPRACCVPTFDCGGEACPTTSFCVHRSGPAPGVFSCEERPAACREATDCAAPCTAERDCITAVCGSFLDAASIEGSSVECPGA